MVNHNPTKQKHELYDSLNEKSASHTVPHKDLNAKSLAMEQSSVHYSKLVDRMNAKSPVQIRQVDGFKSEHGNLEAKPMNSNTLHQTDGDFSITQIPNTGPKFKEGDSLSVEKRTLHQKSKSNIFHD